MNRERVLELATAIQRGLPDVDFDIRYWFSSGWCGTVACIAGHAAILSLGEDQARASDIKEVARGWLELTPVEANQLFMPPIEEPRTVTADMAVRTLRHLADTGEVKWEVVDANAVA